MIPEVTHLLRLSQKDRGTVWILNLNFFYFPSCRHPIIPCIVKLIVKCSKTCQHFAFYNVGGICLFPTRDIFGNSIFGKAVFINQISQLFPLYSQLFPLKNATKCICCMANCTILPNNNLPYEDQLYVYFILW